MPKLPLSSRRKKPWTFLPSGLDHYQIVHNVNKKIVEGGSPAKSYKLRRHLFLLSKEAVHPNRPIFAPANQPAIAQPYTRDRSRVPRERPFMLSGPGVPDLDGLILGARNEPECIGRKAPHAFHMAEEAMDAPPAGDVPQTNGAIQRACQHVRGRLRPVWIVRKDWLIRRFRGR